jgi:hypothetical protein
MANNVERKTLEQFKSQMGRDFARPNLFEVQLNFPGGLDGTGNVEDFAKFQVRAANLPSSQLGVVEVPFRGRVLKIAGDRTFEPWTITVMNSTGFNLRTAFENWVTAIQAPDENFTKLGGLGNENDSAGYFADMSVHQLARDTSTTGGSAGGGAKTLVLKSYKFFNVFPSSISAIDLDFGNNDAIEEFTVELQVQYWKDITKNS